MSMWGFRQLFKNSENELTADREVFHFLRLSSLVMSRFILQKELRA